MSPNILWIVTTQWRAQACGYAGDPNARTPFLDGLATGGVNFSQAVTPHPFGPFARAALLTGVTSPENGIRDYFDPLPLGTRTIAAEMNDRAYATLFFGKWHLSLRDRRAKLTGKDHATLVVPPERRGGFGFWEGFESGFLLNNPWLHGTRLREPVRFEGYQSDVLCDRAAVMLGELAGPWFAVVSLEAPHPPYTAPAGGMVPPDPQKLVLRGNVPLEEQVQGRTRAELAGYYAHIEATDRAIGRLVNALPSEAVVVVTSVHGDMHGSHGRFRKGWPYEESVRVPLLVRLPGQRRQDKRPISLLELPALTLGWAEGVDARTFTGNPDGFTRLSMPSVVEMPDQCDRMWTGIRSRSRKLILNADGTPWLFFDLERDPLERKNLVVDPSRGEEIRALAALLSS